MKETDYIFHLFFYPLLLLLQRLLFLAKLPWHVPCALALSFGTSGEHDYVSSAHSNPV